MFILYIFFKVLLGSHYYYVPVLLLFWFLFCCCGSFFTCFVRYVLCSNHLYILDFFITNPVPKDLGGCVKCNYDLEARAVFTIEHRVRLNCIIFQKKILNLIAGTCLKKSWDKAEFTTLAFSFLLTTVCKNLGTLEHKYPQILRIFRE